MDNQNPFELMQETAQALAQENTKKPWSGFKLRLIFEGQDYNGSFDLRYGKSKVEPIVELEGKVVKVGPNGGIVESHQVDHYFENGVEVPATQVTKMQQLPDGSLEPYADLPKTNTVNIKATRAKDECSIDPNNPATTLGTIIPREEVDRYAAESTYEKWDYAAGLLRLAEYLEKGRLAMYFPFSHGRGTKVYSAVTFPLRIEEKLYLVTRMCSGQLIYSHPIQKPVEAASETTQQPVVVMPRFKAKQKSL